ncbi:MAG: alpha 1,2 mannosyltransferase [Alectoria sarmentosa]|nr:MAG: alpha 1,2 mannosyltransferase [Alectoria sarmentosa]CAD6593438.1 MAG: alpha 1,2 mannosyltransferase [Alectoria sarmentosa]
MWTRTYLALLVVRLYLALQPSYIHPDENFQGPEVIAGNTFAFPHHLTWEFTTNKPVRSLFSLWPVYGLPMLVLHWIWSGIGTNEVPPQVVYYTLRALMFILSFVLEDWAIHELVQSPQHRRLAVTLVASSYVTWTYQTHTFSNSIETLLVAWSLVMVQRILDNKQRSSLLSSAILGYLLTFGIFNRITFPAYLLVPTLHLLPHFLRRPFSLIVFSTAILLTTSLAIIVDTSFYHPDNTLLNTLLTNPTFTPLNSFLYNTQTSNLATHGLHPHYQHLVVSLPLLLGPALYLFFSTPINNVPRLPVLSAISGTLLLSGIPHQEPRFLLPAVPLLLSSIRLPRSKSLTNYWLAAWIGFNTLLGVLMGTYHQGGVVPAQIWLGQQSKLGATMVEILWWRTYSPPIWLLDHSPIRTTDLMGISFASVQMQVETALGSECDANQSVGFVAPYSSREMDDWIVKSAENEALAFEEIWRYGQHVNLDDLDIEGEGIWGTLGRVVGRRGLVVWKVSKVCGVGTGTTGGIR